MPGDASAPECGVVASSLAGHFSCHKPRGRSSLFPKMSERDDGRSRQAEQGNFKVDVSHGVNRLLNTMSSSVASTILLLFLLTSEAVLANEALLTRAA